MVPTNLARRRERQKGREAEAAAQNWVPQQTLGPRKFCLWSWGTDGASSFKSPCSGPCSKMLRAVSPCEVYTQIRRSFLIAFCVVWGHWCLHMDAQLLIMTRNLSWNMRKNLSTSSQSRMEEIVASHSYCPTSWKMVSDSHPTLWCSSRHTSILLRGDVCLHMLSSELPGLNLSWQIQYLPWWEEYFWPHQSLSTTSSTIGLSL